MLVDMVVHELGSLFARAPSVIAYLFNISTCFALAFSEMRMKG